MSFIIQQEVKHTCTEGILICQTNQSKSKQCSMLNNVFDQP